MESFKKYDGQSIVIVASNGEVFIGVVVDYIFPEDNENGLESIVVKTDTNDFYEFTKEHIEMISIE